MAILTINEKTFSYNCDFCSKHTEKPIEFHRAAKLRNQTLFFCSQNAIINSDIKNKILIADGVVKNFKKYRQK